MCVHSGLGGRRLFSWLLRPSASRCCCSPFLLHGGCSASCSSSLELPRFLSTFQHSSSVLPVKPIPVLSLCDRLSSPNIFGSSFFFLDRNGVVKQNDESDLCHSWRLSVLLHRLHDATVDRVRHPGVEDSSGRLVHDIGGLHPAVVVGLFSKIWVPQRASVL